MRCVSKNRVNGKYAVKIWRFGQCFSLGEYSEKIAAAKVANDFLRKTDEEFFSDVRAKHDLPDDQLALLATIKRAKDLGFKPRLLPENRVWVSHMLNAWGRWAYDGMSEKSPNQSNCQIHGVGVRSGGHNIGWNRGNHGKSSQSRLQR
jgi:hypothetical protein